MTMMSGIWITTQSESNTSPQNNTKLPSINMHQALENYPAELAKDANARTSRTVSVVSAGRPKYSSPGKNLRAADAAAAELPNLTGEARARQQDRVNELVRTAARQNDAFRKANPGVATSQVVKIVETMILHG